MHFRGSYHGWVQRAGWQQLESINPGWVNFTWKEPGSQLPGCSKMHIKVQSVEISGGAAPKAHLCFGMKWWSGCTPSEPDLNYTAASPSSQDAVVQYKNYSPFLTQMDFPMPTNAPVTISDLTNFHVGDESKINGSQVLLLSSRLQKLFWLQREQ